MLETTDELVDLPRHHEDEIGRAEGDPVARGKRCHSRWLVVDQRSGERRGITQMPTIAFAHEEGVESRHRLIVELDIAMTTAADRDVQTAISIACFDFDGFVERECRRPAVITVVPIGDEGAVHREHNRRAHSVETTTGETMDQQWMWVKRAELLYRKTQS